MDLSYAERVAALELPSLYKRRATGDMIEKYNHMSAIYTEDGEYIKPHRSPTRGSQFQDKERKVNK